MKYIPFINNFVSMSVFFLSLFYGQFVLVSFESNSLALLVG